MEDVFLNRLSTLFVRQVQQLRSGGSPIAPRGSGFKSVAEILGSEKWINSHLWMKKAKEEDEEKSGI